MKRLFRFLLIAALAIGSCQLFSLKAYSFSRTWEDDDSRVDGSTDTMSDVDDFINYLSEDIHERILSADGETVQMNSAWTATGQTCADLGTVTTADIDGGTIDDVTAVLTSVTGAAGATVTEFSTDGTLADDSDTACPTEKAVKTYVEGGNFDARVKAWIQFTGTGTIAIQDSFNVTSITDNGTGDYTITWATDFANDDYAIGWAIDIDGFGRVNAIAAGTLRIRTYNLASGATDATKIFVIACGDQ